MVAYDGSSSARRALQHAAALHRTGDDMGVIYVLEPGHEDGGYLAEALLALSDRGIDAAAVARSGNPARTICMAAEREDYDTIVVGRRNVLDSGLLLLGSVASRVVAGAAGNVVVVA